MCTSYAQYTKSNGGIYWNNNYHYYFCLLLIIIAFVVKEMKIIFEAVIISQMLRNGWMNKTKFNNVVRNWQLDCIDQIIIEQRELWFHQFDVYVLVFHRPRKSFIHTWITCLATKSFIKQMTRNKHLKQSIQVGKYIVQINTLGLLFGPIIIYA